MTTSRLRAAALLAVGIALPALAWIAVLEPVRVASPSMLPTLQAGERVWVNKLAYRRRAPARGEVVVLHRPDGRYLKRVVGLPGERIDIVDELVFVDGEPQSLRAVGELEDASGTSYAVLEVALGARRFHILDDPARAVEGGSWRVPAGHYFVLGDHRDRSEDSRAWGPVPREQLLGAALGLD